MKQNSLIQKPINPREEKEKKVLQKIILKARQKLIVTITKTEMLRVELEMVKQEYHVRVGSLYLRSNQQDLEIIYYKNLLELMHNGYSYEEAVKKLDTTYYGQQKKMEEEREKLKWEKEIFNKREKSENNPEENDIKKLWKYLVSKFHPDLVLDAKEKKHREEIMKKVNRAYEEKNYNMLLQLKNEVSVEMSEENTIEKLTEFLIDIENEIIQQEIFFKELKNSEWHIWKLKIEKAKKQNKDIFIEIERPLLNEIVRNDEILHSLRVHIEQLRETHSPLS